MGPNGQRLGAGGCLVRAQARLLGWATPRRTARLRCRAGERKVNGPRGKKAMWAESEEGEEIIIFPFYFPNKFSQKHFQIIFLNSFEL